jgi:hypothetical protein
MSGACAAVLAAAMLQMWTPPLRVIDHGALSHVDEARSVVARNQDEWAAAWRAHAPARPLPAIDWSKEIVVGVFAGSRRTGGYRVEIIGYRAEDGRTIVGYRETAPARGALTAQVITSPYAIAAIPRQSGEVVFERASDF